MKITNEVVEAYLDCKYKGHLKLAGESGTVSDYLAMVSEARRTSRVEAVAGLVARFPDASLGVPVTGPALKEGKPLLVDAALEDEAFSLRFDALWRAEGASKLGQHHYQPVLHLHGDR